MTAFHHPIRLAANQADPPVEIDALVDTGSTYTWVPSVLLDQLGVQPQFALEFETADGRVLQRDVAEAIVYINGQARTTLVVFGDLGTEPLLGVHTLGAFLLAVDPVNERLLPVRGRLK